MAKFIFVYHGGSGMPSTPEEGAAVMAKWQAWLGGLGAAVVDGGNPAGPSMTVGSSGVTEGGGANPMSGYSLVEADNMEAAIEMAKGCPAAIDGTVEVAEAMEI